MSSRRQRSESRSRSRDRDRSRSPRRNASPLPDGASPISDSDYFLKSDEFRIWLKDEKRKYFDELTSEKARKYFHKFVKAWNGGKLPRFLYSGISTTQEASSQTAYKWSFASKTSRSDAEALRAARNEVGLATYNRHSSSGSGPSGSRRLQGPTLPSHDDLVLSREAAEEERNAERDYKRKRDRKAAKEKVEEMVGPKEVGREGMLEKKRAKREGDRAFREKGDEGLELDETTLMGGGDSFKDQIARRDAARKRFEEKRLGPRDERQAIAAERVTAIRQKDQATMSMFMQMAKEKFG